MSTYISRENNNGVLLPFSEVVKRISFLRISLWSFRNITIVHPEPFGLSVDDFELITRKLEFGFVVGNRDFNEFLNADFQLIDGFISAYMDHSLVSPLFKLECIDSTQWEFTDVDDRLSEQLTTKGFQRED